MAANRPAALVAREYLRVSKDRSGRMRSPAETHDDNAEHAEREGWTLGEPYTESKAVGASRYSVGVRAGFESLVSDLEAGRFGAQVLIMWSSSRGSRRLSEWARFLELLLDNEVKLYVTTHGRLYDLSHWRDMRTMQEDGSDNEAEVAKLRLGVVRALAANAAEGRPHGVPPFGLRAVHDERTGRLLGWELDPAPCGTSGLTKVDVVKELFDRLDKGHSFRSIAAAFEEMGIVNGSGRPFSPEHLRHLATRTAYTGIRSHHGQLTEAIWPKIIGRAQWYRVARVLSGPKHQTSTSRPGRAVHTYSQMIKCDVCSGPMSVQEQRPGRLEYRCQEGGHVRVGKDAVDAFLDAVIVGYLSRPDVYEQLAAAPERSEQVEQLEEQIAQNQRELDEAEAAEPATLAEGRMFGKVIDNLKKQIAEDGAALRALTMPSELAQLIEPGEDVATAWSNAPVSTRRRIAAILLSPAFLGEVRIKRSPNPRRGAPIEQRLTWLRHDR